MDPTDFVLLDTKYEPAVLRRMKKEGISVLGLPSGGIEEEKGDGTENTNALGAVPGGFADLNLNDSDAD